MNEEEKEACQKKQEFRFGKAIIRARKIGRKKLVHGTHRHRIVEFTAWNVIIIPEKRFYPRGQQ